MATYLELKAQAEKLLAEAEAMRQKEVEDSIVDIKAKMKAYGITARDLGLHTGTVSGSPKRPRGVEKTVKYRGPNGETWGGGRGRKPDWVLQALKSGRQLDEFAVQK